MLNRLTIHLVACLLLWGIHVVIGTQVSLGLREYWGARIPIVHQEWERGRLPLNPAPFELDRPSVDPDKRNQFPGWLLSGVDLSPTCSLIVL